jgi:hypothetical protein
LHAKREFVIGNGRFQLIVVAPRVHRTLVQIAQQLEFRALQAFAGFRSSQIGHRQSAGLENRALERGGQEAAVKIVEATWRNQPAVEDHKARQVAALAPQAIGHPSAGAGPPLLAVTRVEKIIGIGVLGKVGDHRTHYREIINAACDMRKQLAHRDPALAVLSKLPRRFQHLAHVVELRGGHLHFDCLAMLAIEPRLGIERIDLRRPSIHVEKDDVFGLGWMMKPRQHAAQLGRQHVGIGRLR